MINTHALTDGILRDLRSRKPAEVLGERPPTKAGKRITHRGRDAETTDPRAQLSPRRSSARWVRRLGHPAQRRVLAR